MAFKLVGASRPFSTHAAVLPRATCSEFHALLISSASSFTACLALCLLLMPLGRDASICAVTTLDIGAFATPSLRVVLHVLVTPASVLCSRLAFNARSCVLHERKRRSCSVIWHHPPNTSCLAYVCRRSSTKLRHDAHELSRTHVEDHCGRTPCSQDRARRSSPRERLVLCSSCKQPSACFLARTHPEFTHPEW